MRIDASIDQIRKFAEAKGWRNSRLAREAGLHQNTLRNFDDPEWSPTVGTLRKLEALIEREGA